MHRRIYLDHAATTPLHPHARAAMLDGFDRWANPSSVHTEGRAARAALERARERIKAALDWPHDLILTSGASEAVEIALRGAGQMAVSATEHDAVLRAARGAARIAVGRDGRVTAPCRRSDLEGDGTLLAVQHANSETGVLQRALPGTLRLADAAQTAGKLPLPDADLIVVSAHKLGGPPGIGALLVRDLSLLEATGGQERGYRGGTENLPAALGFAAALEAPRGWFDEAAAWRASLDAAIRDAGGEVVADGSPRIPTIASYRMPGVQAATQLIRLDLAGFAVSAGSACSSGSWRASHVLEAMGWAEAPAREVLRVSFGWSTTAAEVAAFAQAWTRLADDARRRAA